MTFTKPVIAAKTIKKYDRVLFGSAMSRPYTPYTLLRDVTIETRDTRSSGSLTFKITGTLPDGRVIQAEGYAYKKGRSPWKFSNSGLTPLEYHSGMISHKQNLTQFLFEPGEWESYYPYEFPEIVVDKPGWIEKQTWQEW